MSTRKLSLRLYQEHRKAFLVYANRLTGDHAQAEDLVQEAWVLFEQQNKIEISAPVHYFKTIMRNLFRFSYRRQKLEKTRDTDFDNASRIIADLAPSPEQVADARWQVSKLLDQIEAMPPRQTAAIKMYYFEGLKLREIAAELNISVSFAQSLIADGIEACTNTRATGE